MPASCIIHRQRRADAGAAPLRPPGPHTPNRERGGQGSDTRRRLRATPDLLKPDAAKATLRKAGGQVRESSAGLKRDQGTGSRPARPLAALRRLLVRLASPSPQKTGNLQDRGSRACNPPALIRGRSRRARGSRSLLWRLRGQRAPSFALSSLPRLLQLVPAGERGCGGRGAPNRSKPHLHARIPLSQLSSSASMGMGPR